VSQTQHKPKMVPLQPKPMARVTRVPLFEREVRERLSNAAVEVLLGRAAVLAEGQRSQSATARHAFFGSIMITIELAGLDAALRDDCSPESARRVAEMMEVDARVLKKLRQLAEREASRLAGAAIRVHSADVRVRAEGTRVLVDIDVEE
jgi:hypothetical protein